mgnify:CR=1 FL=1
MSRENGNEMEQIQKNLERFLDREVEKYEKGEAGYRDDVDMDESEYEEESLYEDEAEYDEESEYGDEEEYDGEPEYEDEEKYEEEPEYDDEGEYDGEPEYEDEREDDEPDYDEELYDEEEEPLYEEERYGGRRPGRRRYDEPERAVRKDKGREKPKKEKPKKEKRKREEDKHAVMSRDKKKNGKKKSRGKKVLTVLAVLLVLFGAVWYLAIGSIYGKMRYNRLETLAGEPLKENGVVNILLIGSDSRTEGDDGRSDAMILLSVSSKTRTIHMTSLLRDMYVDIPGRNGNRLNAAYSFGGPELLLETVKQNLGIEVNRYAVVNFQAFANLVDAVNGVDLELTNEEVKWVNAYLNEYNELRGMPMETDYLDTSLSGMIHLNGAQSLAYSRNRFIGTDFGRTERQRKVLSAVMKKLPAALVTNPNGLINGLFPNLTTNLTQTECLRLSLMGGKLLTYDIVQESIPLEGTYSSVTIRGMDVLQVDFDRNRAYLQEQLYGKKTQ